MKTFRKTLNAQGSLDGSVDLAESAITGSYSLEVYTSNDVLLATQPFRIEEFVPDRIKVTAQLDRPFLEAGDASKLNIHAVNFFGPPAANRNYECEIQVHQRDFRPKNYNNYDFSLSDQSKLFDKNVRQGKTDDQGNAVEKYDVPDIFKNIGLLQATFYATVFDETGRPVSRSTSVDIYTQPVFFGVADDGYWFYPLNQPVSFPLIAIDRSEKIVGGATARVQVIKHEYHTVLTKNGDYFRYESQEEDKLITSGVVSISGDATRYSFTPRTPGDYELRVSIPGSNSYVSKSFYSWGTWGGDNSNFQVNNEGHIDISLDKTSYYTGESVGALFKTPFDGRMLITTETDKVLSYQYVDVDKRQAHVSLPLTADDIPNVYITATLVKPHELSDIPLTVAHGFQSVKVEAKERHMPVEIEAQTSVRSHTHQKVTVKASPGSMVTLAAVDNGVLQVTDFTTPDPYAHFYAKRALEVSDYDLYPLLFPEIKAALSSTGGDGDLKKRTNPVPAHRIRILSYWSGIAQANGSGEANFEFDIPQFSGSVRLMAVAYKEESFGSKDATMTVADPIVLSSALPRFMSPGDTVTMPVTISNTTASGGGAEVKLRLSGPLHPIGDPEQSINIAANSEGRAEFKLAASPAIGIGKVTVDVNSKGERFTDETEIGIRPSAPLTKSTGSGSIAGGSSQPVNWSISDYIPSSVDYQLVLSKSPAAEMGPWLSRLVEYPYGCTEQTVSIAFPQLYFGDLADLVRTKNVDASQKANANANVQEAIRKIKMRQLYNGAVTLWDDEGTENWWATIYAAHFLIEAQKAGFDVDKSLLSTMLGYINNRLKNRETVLYWYNRTFNRKIAPEEVTYGLYVLALAGQPDVSVMNYYKANPNMLSLDCRYMLSAAYALAGDRRSFQQFLPASFSGEEANTMTGGCFASDIRDESLALDVLVDADPNNPQIPIMARHVMDKLKQRTWFSTQELAFSVLGLGKVARQAAGSSVTAEVEVDGRKVGAMDGNPLKLSTREIAASTTSGAAPRVTINTHGSGKLYYFWETEGISATGSYKEEDSYLKVRKRFFDRFGRPLTSNNFKQNDLVIVQITLERTFSTDVDNIVITDMLPAGFEIENPRTKNIPGMDWVKDDDSPTALDVRDDRINLFVDLHSMKQTYYYAVRAVSPGLYHMGPVSADAMYNGEYHSYNGAGTIRITQ